jgi:hypothetical protein
MKEERFGARLALALIALAVVGRAIPHPPNFTPMLAVALLGGATLRGRLAYAVPIGAMLLSDLLLGHAFSRMTLVIYACMAAGTALGVLLQAGRGWGRTGLAAMSGSVLFYLVTNFTVWVGSQTLYAHTATGLLHCYVAALPFFRNALAGDLFWTAFLFGILALGKSADSALPRGSD